MTKMTSNDIKHNLQKISDNNEIIEYYISDFESYSNISFDENQIEDLYDDFTAYVDNSDF